MTTSRDGAPATAPRIEFLVPIRTGLGLNGREHWRARAKRVKAERLATSHAARTHRLPDCRRGPVVVALVRLSPGTRPMDSDNLPGAMKAIRDQLAAEMLIDDADPRVSWEYGQERAKHHGVRVEMAWAPRPLFPSAEEAGPALERLRAFIRGAPGFDAGLTVSEHSPREPSSPKSKNEGPSVRLKSATYRPKGKG